MIFLMLCLIPTIISAGFWYKSAREGDNMPISMLFCMISIMLTITVVAVLVMYPIDVRQDIAEYYAVKETIKNARVADITDIERAALTHKIVETNKWVAGIKYNNSVILFDDFIPDEVNDLEPLR